MRHGTNLFLFFLASIYNTIVILCCTQLHSICAFGEILCCEYFHLWIPSVVHDDFTDEFFFPLFKNQIFFFLKHPTFVWVPWRRFMKCLYTRLSPGQPWRCQVGVAGTLTLWLRVSAFGQAASFGAASRQTEWHSWQRSLRIRTRQTEW